MEDSVNTDMSTSLDTPRHQFRSNQEEARISAETRSPRYSYSKRDGGSLITVYGYNHVYGLQEVTDMEQTLQAKQPTLLLTEGEAADRAARIADDTNPEQVIKQFGEQTYIAWKAKQRGITVKSWDRPLREEVAALQGKHAKEAIAGWIMAQGIKHLKDSQSPQTPAELRRRFEDAYGISVDELQRQMSIDLSDENMQKVARKYAKRSFQDITYDEAESLATPRIEGETNNVIREMNENRDLHALEVIQQEKPGHQNIMVTAGKGHAIRWEPAIEALYPEEA